jgi:hypothetical protein
MNPWSQTIRARILKIYTIIDHVPNDLNLKGHGVNLKTVGLTIYAVNVKIPPKISIFKYVQEDPSLENPWSQMVRARILKIYTIIDHVPNNLNLKWHKVNLKTVGLSAYAVNVKIPLKTHNFKSHQKLYILTAYKMKWKSKDRLSVFTMFVYQH